MIVNFNDYQQCSMCGEWVLKKDLFLCDGILGKTRGFPFGKYKNWTCDRPICKNCKKSVGGYDFCNSCFRRRESNG